MTITEFLLARIAEDEADARGDDGSPAPIGMWDPDRVLTECEAKRRIVADAALYGCANTMATHLATVYADHPDFDPAWRA